MKPTNMIVKEIQNNTIQLTNFYSTLCVVGLSFLSFLVVAGYFLNTSTKIYLNFIILPVLLLTAIAFIYHSNTIRHLGKIEGFKKRYKIK